VLGKVRAGLPQMEDQTSGLETVGVEDYLIRHPERTVFCRVRGDSMKDAGMLDGDMVVVERNRPTKSGDIVVALVDHEMTVKHLFPSTGSGGWVLKPANPDYPDIVAQESLEIIGVVVGVFRRF
jgi:repressor LexA